MSSMQGRNAVITGGTRGIGRAIAEHLVDLGATVSITGTDRCRVQAVATEIAAAHDGPTVGVDCDVANEPSVVELARQAKAELGVVDVLVTNAAIARRNPVPQISLSEWAEVMAVNVTGTFLSVRELLPLMTGRAPAIVIVASQSGKRGEALLSHYAASKAAQIGMARSFALEFAPKIRVNAVCPGYVETDMLLEHYDVQGRLLGLTPEQVRDELNARVPLGRMQSAASVASAVAFLAGNESSDITGEAINVCGGMIMD